MRLVKWVNIRTDTDSMHKSVSEIRSKSIICNQRKFSLKFKIEMTVSEVSNYLQLSFLSHSFAPKKYVYFPILHYQFNGDCERTWFKKCNEKNNKTYSAYYIMHVQHALRKEMKKNFQCRSLTCAFNQGKQKSAITTDCSSLIRER